MLKTEIEILEKIIEGEKSQKEIGKEIGKGKSWVSQLLKDLEKRNLIKKNGKVRLNDNYEARLISSLREKYSLEKLLKGKREEILRNLIEPKNISDLERIGFSKTSLYLCLQDLKEIGAIVKNRGKCMIKDDVKEYVKASQKHHPFATLFYSNHEKVGKTFHQRIGIPTAFSVFYKYGVDYFPKDNYFYSGERKLEIEDILIHSILSAENKKQMSIACIFYLKNRRKIDNSKVKKRAEKYRCLSRWVEVLNYLDGGEVKSNLFPAHKEFSNMAKNYQVMLREKYSKQKLLDCFQKLGGKLEREANIYLIGGANLILRYLKDSTKDFDVIVERKEDFNCIVRTLKELGFSETRKLEKTYKNLEPATILRKDGCSNWDIFVKKVCNALVLTSGMKKRSELFKSFYNLRLNLVSLDDIFLFKSITDREGDLEDAALLARKGKVNWNNIIKEMKEQEKISKRYFSFSLLDTLDILKDEYGIEVPILKDLVSYCLKNALLLGLKEPKTIKDLKKELDFPEHQIYNKLKKMEKEGKIKVDRRGKLNKYMKV